METTAFSHTGNIGDVWASIPAINEYHRKTGKQVILHLINGHKAEYYEGAVHPTKNDNGEHVMLNEKMIEMMIPLLKAQPSIADAKMWEGEDIQVALGEIRNTNVGMPGFSINRWYFTVYPDLACDLSGKWLTVPDAEKDLAKGKIIITRSERYLNERINYSFLKPFEDDLLFCGTMREYNNFCMLFDLNIRKFNITNFLELAQAIKQCRFHLTNQTQAFQLSEGQKVPRILETCYFAPNCIPIGEDAYDFMAQDAVEYYFNYLHKKTA
jgi:energy-coupling factor transporter ATP-binding protein EcfA2